MVYDVLVVGGGAGGFFTAINIAENHPQWRVAIFEKSREVLSKVKISGGGRCNVTHADFIPQSLVKNYPRGEKELLGPFHHFMTGDVMEWFEKRGVPLKIEEDGRVFPQSDNSQSIIDCFLQSVKKLQIPVFKKENVVNLSQIDDYWQIETSTTQFRAKNVVVATGSNPKIWQMLSELGHTIVKPVPSLFTFNCKDEWLKNLQGISAKVNIQLLDESKNPLKIQNKRIDKGGSIGALLITHWGISGPAVLKLSAWGARALAMLNYRFSVRIDWLPNIDFEELQAVFEQEKQKQPKQKISNFNEVELPKRLWQALVAYADIDEHQTWANLSKKAMFHLVDGLKKTELSIDGKSTFKEEFVTSGGVALQEIDFKTFESKWFKGLYFSGEVLDIDAVTGGFNFQNAWTSGFLIAKHLQCS